MCQLHPHSPSNIGSPGIVCVCLVCRPPLQGECAANPHAKYGRVTALICRHTQEPTDTGLQPSQNSTCAQCHLQPFGEMPSEVSHQSYCWLPPGQHWRHGQRRQTMVHQHRTHGQHEQGTTKVEGLLLALPLGIWIPRAGVRGNCGCK